MLLYFSIPVLFLVLGCIIWWAASPTKPKASEFGHIMVAVGLFWLCSALGAHYLPRH